MDALTYFRLHHRRVPVIVVTAHAGHELADQARAAGAFDVLGKPFDMAILQGMVAQAMRLAPRD